MAYLDDLKTRRDEVAGHIKDLTTDGLNKPDASGPGVNSQFTSKIKSLYDELRMLNELIANAEPGIVETHEIP